MHFSIVFLLGIISAAFSFKMGHIMLFALIVKIQLSIAGAC